MLLVRELDAAADMLGKKPPVLEKAKQNHQLERYEYQQSSNGVFRRASSTGCFSTEDIKAMVRCREVRRVNRGRLEGNDRVLKCFYVPRVPF